MDRGQVALIAAVVLVPAILLWVIFLARQSRASKPSALLGIPQALRPGAPDEVLEGPRLQAILMGGVLATLALAIFIPVYWLGEPQRAGAFEERFEEEALHRGELIYGVPPELEEDAPAAEFKEQEKALALGQGCVNCHGPEGTGGNANPPWKDPLTGEVVTYKAPPLNDVFQRWDEEVVRFTIERGRPGTPMPTWGVEFGGSMTPLMVDDVMEYLKSIQIEPEPLSEDCQKPEKSAYQECGEEIFQARCAVCHGPQGQGKEDKKNYPDPLDADEPPKPVWYQGMALWNGDVRHLDRSLHYYTIVNGRRFAFMPPFGEAPAQGIPINPNPLTDEQIQAVMTYERSL